MINHTLDTLVQEIGAIHYKIQNEAIRSVSRSLTIRNWLIGYYIFEYEQNGQDRANYGDKLIENLSKKLSHIKGMSRSNLHSFKLFYISYPQISQTLSGQFKLANEKIQTLSGESKSVDIQKLLNVCSFSHFVELIKIDEPTKRLFYEIETIKGNWSVRELSRQINSLSYERVGLSKNKEEILKSLEQKAELLTTNQIIKDPYILEFTGLELKAKYDENDLETALINHLQDFLLELGNGFCFEARQKRISIDNEHDRIDLVFYHRILKCHILIDLKIREFSHKDVEQMNFYLNYYKNEIMQQNDNPPIGLILCANKNHTKVEYATAGLDSQLFVSKYKINLPSIEEIEMFLEEEIKVLS